MSDSGCSYHRLLRRWQRHTFRAPDHIPHCTACHHAADTSWHEGRVRTTHPRHEWCGFKMYSSRLDTHGAIVHARASWCANDLHLLVQLDALGRPAELAVLISSPLAARKEAARELAALKTARERYETATAAYKELNRGKGAHETDQSVAAHRPVSPCACSVAAGKYRNATLLTCV